MATVFGNQALVRDYTFGAETVRGVELRQAGMWMGVSVPLGWTQMRLGFQICGANAGVGTLQANDYLLGTCLTVGFTTGTSDNYDQGSSFTKGLIYANQLNNASIGRYAPDSIDGAKWLFNSAATYGDCPTYIFTRTGASPALESTLSSTVSNIIPCEATGRGVFFLDLDSTQGKLRPYLLPNTAPAVADFTRAHFLAAMDAAIDITSVNGPAVNGVTTLSTASSNSLTYTWDNSYAAAFIHWSGLTPLSLFSMALRIVTP